MKSDLENLLDVKKGLEKFFRSCVWYLSSTVLNLDLVIETSKLRNIMMKF